MGRTEEWIPGTGKGTSDFGPRMPLDAEIRKRVVKGRAVELGTGQVRLKAIGFQCYGC